MRNTSTLLDGSSEVLGHFPCPIYFLPSPVNWYSSAFKMAWLQGRDEHVPCLSSSLVLNLKHFFPFLEYEERPFLLHTSNIYTGKMWLYDTHIMNVDIHECVHSMLVRARVAALHSWVASSIFGIASWRSGCEKPYPETLKSIFQSE